HFRAHTGGPGGISNRGEQGREGLNRVGVLGRFAIHGCGHYNRELALSTTQNWPFRRTVAQQLVAVPEGPPAGLYSPASCTQHPGWRHPEMDMADSFPAFAERLNEALDRYGFQRGRG